MLAIAHQDCSKPLVHELYEGVNYVGRSGHDSDSLVDVSIDDPSVSYLHAEINVQIPQSTQSSHHGKEAVTLSKR